MTSSIKDIKYKIKPILKKHKVTKQAIFGSFAKGEATQKSDLDILVKLESDKTLLDLVDLKLDLEKTLNRKVDVLTYDSISPLLKNKIYKEMKEI